MDATLERKVEELAHEIAGDAKTIQDVNHVLRLMMKSTLERMLDTEMDVHLGRRPACREDALDVPVRQTRQAVQLVAAKPHHFVALPLRVGRGLEDLYADFRNCLLVGKKPVASRKGR